MSQRDAAGDGGAWPGRHGCHCAVLGEASSQALQDCGGERCRQGLSGCRPPLGVAGLSVTIPKYVVCRYNIQYDQCASVICVFLYLYRYDFTTTHQSIMRQYTGNMMNILYYTGTEYNYTGYQSIIFAIYWCNDTFVPIHWHAATVIPQLHLRRRVRLHFQAHVPRQESA